MSNVIKEYFDALQRIIDGKPRIVAKGTKVTNDAVALEAGRSKGSIKKSRPVFEDLIKTIEKASKGQQDTPLKKAKDSAIKSKAKTDEYKQLYNGALNRELMLIERIAFLEKELRDIKLKNPMLKV